MHEKATLHIALKAVRDSALLGVTSSEISNTTGISNNRITAALSRLLELGCVRREKVFGSFARHRYWYVREIEDALPLHIDVPVTRRTEAEPVKAPPPRLRWGADASGVSIRLKIGPRGHIAVTPEQARDVYSQLALIFGK